MLKSSFQSYLDAASENTEICIIVCLIETGEEISASYDVTADISEYGECVIKINIWNSNIGNHVNEYVDDFNYWQYITNQNPFIEFR